MSKPIPRSSENDYTDDIVRQRQDFIEEQTPAKLHHTRQYSFQPGDMAGNIENLFGVAQIPIGLAGPLRVNGEHANGEFYVPMATVEGTACLDRIPKNTSTAAAASRATGESVAALVAVPPPTWKAATAPRPAPWHWSSHVSKASRSGSGAAVRRYRTSAQQRA